ncbi:MAG TPA: FKBP-type peptidyl-prolyl cis-trans isomerase [Aeromicrobium sp.]|nr:FKBP-type peptidyl-prolyl cis-trans isomerase [Aeromicrobium sp.]
MIRKLALALLVPVLLTGALAACSADEKPTPLPSGVPSIVDSNGIPTGFQKTNSTPAHVAKTRLHVVKAGKGATIKASGSVTAQYMGQIYPAGTVFDSSYERGEPATFPLNGVIPCWRDLLAGQKVGSRVVLLCQSKDAYDKTPPPGSGIEPGDDLIFLVDIINAS